MTEVSTAAPIAASAESPTAARFDYVSVHDVYAGLAGGGSLSVEEYPHGEIVEAAKAAERRAGAEDTGASLVIGLTADTVGGAAHDTVWFHPDQNDRLAVIARARAALDATEAALDAVGYVDNVHACAQAFRTPAQREADAFEWGFERGQLDPQTTSGVETSTPSETADEISMRIILRPDTIRGADKGDSHTEPSPRFIAQLMDLTGLPFEDLFEIVRERHLSVS